MCQRTPGVGAFAAFSRLFCAWLQARGAPGSAENGRNGDYPRLKSAAPLLGEGGDPLLGASLRLAAERVGFALDEGAAE